MDIEIPSYMADMKPEFIETFKNRIRLRDHLKQLLVERKLEVSGQTQHFSIDYYVNGMFAKIDRPKKYAWQADTVFADDFFHLIERRFENYNWVSDLSDARLVEVIAGNDEYIMKGSRDGGKCLECDGVIHMHIKGNRVGWSGTQPCGHIRNYTVDIDFPTGEVVFGDFPYRFDELQETGILGPQFASGDGILSDKGQSDHYAKLGILFMFVGNNSPSLNFNPTTNAIWVGNSHFYDDEDNDCKRVEFEGFDELGRIDTQLWWTTMLDKSKYDALVAEHLPAERPNPSPYDRELQVAKVKPGRYRFMALYAHTPVGSGPHDIPGVYIKAEYLGPCD